MTDGYQAYRHLGRRLRCWAHLIRKCQGLIDSTDSKVARAGKGMHEVLCALMEAIYAARAAQGQSGQRTFSLSAICCGDQSSF